MAIKVFAQFQAVFPKDKAEKGLIKVLDRISRSGCGSFLAVLKQLGQEESGISFYGRLHSRT